eukprot:2866738-Lingulodinium_polyedra.AAC.1
MDGRVDISIDLRCVRRVDRSIDRHTRCPKKLANAGTVPKPLACPHRPRAVHSPGLLWAMGEGARGMGYG